MSEVRVEEKVDVLVATEEEVVVSADRAADEEFDAFDLTLFTDDCPQVAELLGQVDIGALQDVMENLTFCDIEAEDLRYVDPNFMKLFQLAQLMIEYLLHSQDFLAGSRQQLIEELEVVSSRAQMLTDTNEKQAAELNALKKESRIVRKTLYAYQLMAKMPGGLGSTQPTVITAYH
ncbi:Zinc finger protein dzip1, partial [Borealophlyctis nickersoniae]